MIVHIWRKGQRFLYYEEPLHIIENVTSLTMVGGRIVVYTSRQQMDFDCLKFELETYEG